MRDAITVTLSGQGDTHISVYFLDDDADWIKYLQSKTDDVKSLITEKMISDWLTMTMPVKVKLDRMP